MNVGVPGSYCRVYSVCGTKPGKSSYTLFDKPRSKDHGLKMRLDVQRFPGLEAGEAFAFGSNEGTSRPCYAMLSNSPFLID